MVLEWESADDLVKLRDDLWAELQPQGRLEEETVLGIVNLTWHKRRVMRAAQLGYRRDPFAIEVARANPASLDDIVTLITSAVQNGADLSSKAKESLDSLKKAIEKINQINIACFPGHSQTGDAKKAFEAAHTAAQAVKFVEKISRQVFDRLVKLEEASKTPAATVYEKAYSSEHLEKLLRIEAALDARIDKQLSRLVNLKEYKRLRKETSGQP